MLKIKFIFFNFLNVVNFYNAININLKHQSEDAFEHFLYTEHKFIAFSFPLLIDS